MELLTPAREADRWDQHFRLEEGHRINSRAVDKPLAALIKDLKGLGMLDETIVIWAENSAALPPPRSPTRVLTRPGETITPSASRCGWPVAASGKA